MQAVETHRASVRLDGQTIIKEVSFELPVGRIIGLLGPSGAGKTTLIRAIVGRQSLSDGSITVLGRPAGAATNRRSIGYMTQGVAVYPDLSVTENLRFFAAMAGVGREAVGKALEQVELAPQAKQLAATLSGGQKSRLSLAVALLGHPKLLVLDEPTVGVDPVLRQQLWELFKQLASDGATLLVTSHVMDEAEHCQDILLLRDGRLLAQGSPADLKQRAKAASVEEAFLRLVGQTEAMV